MGSRGHPDLHNLRSSGIAHLQDLGQQGRHSLECIGKTALGGTGISELQNLGNKGISQLKDMGRQSTHGLESMAALGSRSISQPKNSDLKGNSKLNKMGSMAALGRKSLRAASMTPDMLKKHRQANLEKQILPEDEMELWMDDSMFAAPGRGTTEKVPDMPGAALIHDLAFMMHKTRQKIRLSHSSASMDLSDVITDNPIVDPDIQNDVERAVHKEKLRYFAKACNHYIQMSAEVANYCSPELELIGIKDIDEPEPIKDIDEPEPTHDKKKETLFQFQRGFKEILDGQQADTGQTKSRHIASADTGAGMKLRGTDSVDTDVLFESACRENSMLRAIYWKQAHSESSAATPTTEHEAMSEAANFKLDSLKGDMETKLAKVQQLNKAFTSRIASMRTQQLTETVQL